nr:Protein kintoun [Polyrhizophydium stewartii]
MCSSPELAQAEPDSKQPTAPAGSAAGSTRGQNWRIPYSLAPPRDDVDHAKKPCKVYDCVFHPETLRFGASRPAFANLLAITAIEGIERQFGVKLDRGGMMLASVALKRAPLTQSDADFKTIKMKSKGTPSTTIIRTTKENFVKPDRETSIEFIERIKQEQGRAEASPEASANSSLLATPKYTIVHQQLFSDYQRFTSERERDQTSRPDAILIKISLPGVASDF